MNTPLQEIIHTLKDRTVLQVLTPVRIWNAELDTKISALKFAKAADKSVIALMAGLHLWNDNLNASHSFSQEIEDDATGSYWHGLMHRMEQDYWNSQYWFRRVGNHPVKQAVQPKVADLLMQQDQLDSLPPSRIVSSLKQYRDQRGWNCDDFVDTIKLQENEQGSQATRELLEQLQHIEFITLFEHTYEAALKALPTSIE